MNRCALAACLVLICGTAMADDFLPTDDLALRAIGEQPEVRAATADVEAARAEARGLDAGPHEWTLGVIPQQRTTRNGASFHEWETQLGRSFRWPGKARLDREIGEHARNGAELRLDDVRHQAARRLASAWMDWLRTGTVVIAADAQLALVQRQRDVVARRVSLGDASVREREMLDAECAQWQVEALAAQREADSARQRLSTGFPTLPVPERLPALPEPQPLEGGATPWRERIVARSHEISAAMEEAARQDALARRSRADRRADPEIGVRVMRERDGAESAIGIVLGIPFGGARRAANADREAARADAMQAQAQAMRRQIEIEAWETVHRAESLRDAWRMRVVALEATTAVAARTKRAHELGETSLTELLFAQRNARQAALDEARARVDALEAALLVRIDAHETWHPADDEGPQS